MLDPVAQGGPYTIEVHQYIKEEVSNLSLKDIYFGDVWICSGQSNMEMTVSQVNHIPINSRYGLRTMQERDRMTKHSGNRYRASWFCLWKHRLRITFVKRIFWVYDKLYCDTWALNLKSRL